LYRLAATAAGATERTAGFIPPYCGWLQPRAGVAIRRPPTSPLRATAPLSKTRR
jgi:hypothetical protein